MCKLTCGALAAFGFPSNLANINWPCLSNSFVYSHPYLVVDISIKYQRKISYKLRISDH